MGNCWCRLESSDYRVSSNVKSEQNQVIKQRHDDSKLPSNPEEVEDLRRDSAANPLIAFTYDELKLITGNFRPDRVLGGGGFGSVYKGFISEVLRQGLPSVAVAVKVHDGDNSHQGHREWLAEVIFLGQLSHPNLVKLIGYCCEDEHRVLIYEYMARGSVEHNLFSKILLPLPWSIRMKIAFGAAKGLAFLHEAEKPVIYRDFKTSNILLDQDYNAKLSDFGLAKDGPVGDKSHVSTRIMGTYGYAAPEYIMTGHLTPRSDVYSFGVVLLELLTGRKSLDKLRPAREQNLTEWALPLLKEKKKILNIIDPRPFLFAVKASPEVGSEAPKQGSDKGEGEEEPYEEYEVELDQPYGLRFVKGRDGGTYIDAIAPGGAADKAGVFTVGDKVLATSAVFGTEIWPAAEYGRTMYTIRQRIGPLLMRMQKRYGKIETGGALTEKEIIRAERNSGVISNRVREIQMTNYIRRKEQKEQRENDLKEGLVLYRNAKYEEALEKFESVLGSKPEPDEAAVASYNVACCYSKLNQIKAALSSLEEALNSGFEDFKRIRSDPDLANLRASEDFDPLIKRFDESFINENAINAIKSLFGFNKKQ